MIRLQLFGSIQLTREDGTPVMSVLAQPKRLALLAYLATAKPIGFHRRDSLLALFWPDGGDARARNSLRQSLHFLRRSLGEGVITVRGESDVGIDPPHVTVDAIDFEDLDRAGDYAKAVGLYQGAFMDGFHLPEAPSFDRWMDGERSRLSHLAWRAAMEAAAAAEGSATGIGYARRALEIRPANDVAARSLMALLYRAGDRGGALDVYEQLGRERLERHDSEPEPETVELADQIRLESAQENREVVSGVASSDRSTEGQLRAGSPPHKLERRRSDSSAASYLRSWMWLAAPAMVVAAGLALWIRSKPNEPGPQEVFESPFREGQQPSALGFQGFTLSPDGTTFVYVGPDEGDAHRLWIRRWSETEATPIVGTEGATGPAISPDGDRLAYEQGYEIKVRSLDGLSALSLTRGTNPQWGPDDKIYASTLRLDRVVRGPASGGETEVVTERVPGEVSRSLVDFLPNGWALLDVAFTANRPDEVWALELSTGATKVLVSGSGPSYASNGHLLYIADDGGLFSAPLDLRAMELAGPPIQAYPGPVTGYSLSESGRLFYAVDSRARETLTDEFVWVDREGRATPLGFPFRRGGVFLFGWSLSPDASRLAFTNRVDGIDGIWIKRLPDGPIERLTVGAGSQFNPWWTPDGQSVGFMARPGEVAASGGVRPWEIRADGTGRARMILDEGDRLSFGTWTPDGEWLILSLGPQSGDIVGVRPGVDSTLVPLVATEASERSPSFSPDGRWMAYSSNRTGRHEIYVRPFPNVDSARLLVSTNGGIAPVWAHDGRELFFVDADRALVSAKIETASSIKVTGHDVLFQIPSDFYINKAGLSKFFDVSFDDQQFLMGRPAPRTDQGATVRTFLVSNLFDVLRRPGN